MADDTTDSPHRTRPVDAGERNDAHERRVRWYRDRARETRLLAEEMRTPECRAAMKRLADSYDQIAAHAETATRASGST